MKDKIQCLGCNSKDCSLLVEKTGYKLLKCKECGLVFKNIKKLDFERRQELQDTVYTDSNLEGRLNNPITIAMAKKRFDFFSKYISRGDILEIGCGTGEFLLQAQKSGFNVQGVDAAPVFGKHLKQMNIPIELGIFEHVDFKGKLFDAVVALHLIEHIHVPNEFFEKARSCLKKDGLLFIVTPNVDSKTDKMFGWNHPMYTESDHICLYSPGSLKKMLKKHFFTVIDVATNEPDHHIFTSARMCLTQQRNILAKILSRCIRPYLYARLFTRLLERRASRLDGQLKGHELFIIGQKNEY